MSPHKFSKKDFKFSVVTGLLTGVIVWRILDYLDISEICLGGSSYGASAPGTMDLVRYCNYSLGWEWLVVIVPILWILGVMLGYLLGKWIGFFNQFGKFAAIGFTNAAVDFAVLNILIANTGHTSGGYYSLYKAISFLVALINSYILNKYWAFEASESGGGAMEFGKFFGVALVAIVINNAVASIVVNSIEPVLGLDPRAWANVGAVAGSAAALIFSFIGFKLAVFRK